MRYATRTQPSDPLFTYWTVADAMGYYKEECLSAEVIRLDSGEQAVQAGQAELTVSGPDVMINLLKGSGDSLDLVAIYAQVPKPHYAIAVAPDSPIKTLQDLKGKSIATLSEAFSGTLALKAQLAAVGVDADKDVNIVVLPAGPAAINALKTGQVQALNYYDSAIVLFEQLTGSPLRLVPLVPEIAQVSGPVWVAQRERVKNQRDVFLRYIRAYNKAWVFLNKNLKAAATIEVNRYPELIQQGETKDKAIERLMPVIASRNNNTQIRTEDWAQPKVLGWMYKNSWQEWLKILPGVPPTLDVTKAYDNSLVEESWKFDQAPVIKQAETYTAP